MGLWGLVWFDSEMQWGWFPKQGHGQLSPEQDAPGHTEGREGSSAPPAPQMMQHSQFHMTCINNPPNPALTEK